MTSIRLLRGAAVAALVLGLVAASFVRAEVKYPAPPKEYDIEVRFKIRAPLPAWYDRFDEMLAAMKRVGFVREAVPADEQEDPGNDRLAGTISSEKARGLLRVPGVRTILLKPKGSQLPKANERVKVRLELVSGLSPDRQLQLSRQCLPRLQALGFREAIGYDNHGYTWLVGTIEAGQLNELLKDLRAQPSGWLVPRDPIPTLESPFKDQVPVQVIEVLPEPGGVAPMLEPPAPPVFPETKAHFAKLEPRLRALVENEMDETKFLRVEVVLTNAPPELDREWEFPLRSVAQSVLVEGRLGNIATVKVRAVHAAELARLPQVLQVRLPISGEPIHWPAGDATDAVAQTRADRFHQMGNRGQGVKVAVVGGDFGGWDKLLGSRLPKTVQLVDFTAPRNPNLQPDPMPSTDGALGSGTLAALAVHQAAPGAELLLVRIDPNCPHELLLLARILNESNVVPRSLEDRYNELARDREFLDHRRVELLAERKKAYDEQVFDEGDIKVPEQRKRYQESQDRIKRVEAALQAQEKAEKELEARTQRYLQRRSEIDRLKGVRVVVNLLTWNEGHPLDGSGALSKYLDEKPFVGFRGTPTKSRLVSHRADQGTIWVQAAGDTRGQTWVGLFRDEHGDGVMEFAPPSASLPRGRWTRELNFLGWQSHDGKITADMPEKVRVRVAMQWREPHDPVLFAASDDPYRTPLANLGLVILKQRAPTGAKLATDDMEITARSFGTPVRLLHAPHSSTYEVTAEFDVVAGGRFAVRVEGRVPTSNRPGEAFNPALPPLEIRPRILVEAVDAASQSKGRVVFEDYGGDPVWPQRDLATSPAPESQYGGVGMPADARAVLTVGAADRNGDARFYGSVGAGPNRQLLVKPDALGYDSFDLGGGTRGAGSWVAAAFDGGLAACLIGSGAPPEPKPLLKLLDLPPGGVLKIPASWLK